MCDSFWTLCRAEALLPPAGETVLAAVSGGADSMCLLSLLCEAGERFGFSVAAAHFDHHIRPTSGADAAFVEAWCASHGIPFTLGGADVPALARESGLGIEDAARRARYTFLRETAERLGNARIATAHNAGDNAETLLLHLLRGSGLAGLGGIAPRRGQLIRPLLTTTRHEIEAYNAAHAIPHVEDETNGDDAYTRNFLRLRVLPLLETRNPGAVEALNRCARALREDEDCLSAQAEALAAQAVPLAGGAALPVSLLRETHPALAGRVLQRMVSRVDDAVILSSEQRAQALRLVRSDAPSGWVALPHRLRLGRAYAYLTISPAEGGFAPVPLLCPGVTEAGDWRFAVTETVCPGGKFNQPLCFYLKPGDYFLRPRAVGDSVTLPARSRKTVKKLLSDEKLPRAARDRLPVFDAGGQAAALALFGADSAFLPKEGERCWQIVCTPPDGLYDLWQANRGR